MPFTSPYESWIDRCCRLVLLHAATQLQRAVRTEAIPTKAGTPTELPPLDPDDERWDALLPDDEPYEAEPEPGDFWLGDAGIEADEATRSSTR